MFILIKLLIAVIDWNLSLNFFFKKSVIGTCFNVDLHLQNASSCNHFKTESEKNYIIYDISTNSQKCILQLIIHKYSCVMDLDPCSLHFQR